MRDITWVGTNGNNYWTGRNGLPVKGVVNHIMDGFKWGTKSHFQNPDSQASAHFAVHFDGTIWQYVSEGDSAWANGVWESPDLTVPFIKYAWDNDINPNRITISIEHEGRPFQSLTEEQIQATIELQTYLKNKYGLKREDFAGHYQISLASRRNCPSSAYPWRRVLDAVFNTATTNPVPTNPGISWQDPVTGRYVVEPFSSAYVKLANSNYTALEIAGRPLDGMAKDANGNLVQNFERLRFGLDSADTKVRFGNTNAELMAKR